MKFRMFTDSETGEKVAVNVDYVVGIDEMPGGVGTIITVRATEAGDVVHFDVREDFATVFSRLNTVAE